ncbi:MAG TPA: LytR family transcriptional regulator, partial [Chloroflexi bacterium]|nr:LytR family transcriptional regulator [Chloroflexota bacterium]
RINTAHYLGDLYDYPGGGPALAMRTVEYNLGVPIHHYVRLNFQAFIELVDRIGGIDIYVEEEINDPTYPSNDPADPYGYDPLYIPTGWVHMDGELALKYARTRHSPGGDFDRARRQQQVMRAILEKVTRLDLLPQLVSQAPELWVTLNDSVKTDLQLDEIVSLAYLATQIPEENIRTAVIGEECTMFWTTPDGQQVLVPIRDCVRQVRDSVFATPVTPSPSEDLSTQLTQEAATVEVQNGTGTAGLAHSTGEFLRDHGINVISETNADRFDYAESRIYVYTGKERTAEAIAQLLNLPPTAVVAVPAGQAEVDIVVVLGADYQSGAPSPTPTVPSP